MAAKRIGLYNLFYRSTIPCKTLVPLRPACSQREDKKFLTDGETKDYGKETAWEAPLMDHETLVSYMLKKSDAKLDFGDIYIKRPHEEDQLKGRKERKIRLVWEEQDCSESFPDSPEECNLDLLHYLEQRDMWERRRVLHIPKFCVGSIIAVTRADEYAPQGYSRFVGLCIHINHYQNTKGALFALRNVIGGEPLEIQYPFYSPLIQKIEVLRHERWENEMPAIGLRFIRDYPPEYSTVDEKFEPEEYTEEPHIRKWTEEDKDKIIKWFEAIYESRRRR